MHEAQLEVAPSATVGSVFAKFAARFPSLESYRRSVLFASNSSCATPDTPLQDGGEIAFLPPVSGG